MVPKSLYTIFSSSLYTMPVVSKAQRPLYKIKGCVSLAVTILVLYKDPSRPEFVIVIDKAGDLRCLSCLSCLSLTYFRDVAWEDIRDLMVCNAHEKPLPLACFLDAVTQTCKLICLTPRPSLFPSPPCPLYAIVEKILSHVEKFYKGLDIHSLVLSFLHHSENRDITYKNISEKLMHFIGNSTSKSDPVLEFYITELSAQLFAYAKTPTDESLHKLVKMLELSDLICAIYQKWCLDYHKVTKNSGKYVLKIKTSLSQLQQTKELINLMEKNHVEGYLSLRNALQLPTNVSVQFKVEN
jgi:hypothetical protein